MKRLMSMFLCCVLLASLMCTGAGADSSREYTDFSPELANEIGYTSAKWLRNDENRALLTVLLSIEYGKNATNGKNIKLTKRSSVADTEYPLVIVSTDEANTHLMIAYNPAQKFASATAIDISDSFDDETYQKVLADALGAEIYPNDILTVLSVLDDYKVSGYSSSGSKSSDSGSSTKSTGSSSQSTSSSSKSTGNSKITYYNPNNKGGSSVSSASTSKPKATPKASTQYPFKTLQIQFPDYQAVKRYSVNDWYSSSQRRALLTALIETPYDGLRYKDESLPLPCPLFGTSYVGRSGTGQNTLYYVAIETDQPKVQLLFEYNPSKKTAKYALVDVSDNTSARVIEDLCGKDYHKNSSSAISDQYFVALDMQMQYLNTLLKK